MATVAGPEDHNSFDVSDVDSNPLGMHYEAILQFNRRHAYYICRNVQTWDTVDKNNML